MPTTLLLADDSVVIQKLVGLSFVNEDIEIVSVDNGDDAVTRAFECNPDIILADVVMPGKSGYEVCAAIRNNPDLADTPVLLLTGTFEAFDETRANMVKATGHITKPFEAQMLVNRVNEILAQRTPAQATPAAAEPSNDFFADELSNAGESNATADFAPDSAFDQSDILTPAPLAPESTHEINATSIAIESIAGLDDMFGGDPLSDDLGGDFDDNFDLGIDTDLTDPAGSYFPASQGLDIDFGAPASDGIVPENVNDYDVSISDLGVGAVGDAPSWSAGVPDGVETGPAPIMMPTNTTPNVDVMNPTPEVHMQAVSEYDSASEAPITLTEEPAARAPEADISFASSAPRVSPLDQTIGATNTAPVLNIPAPAATASPTGSRPDLTPMMRDRIHDTLEKVAWEAFADLSDDIVRQLMERVEQIAWEVIPQMAETLIQDEIRRMKGEEGEE